MRWVIGLFLVAHGLVHLGVWLPAPAKGKVPFDAGHSPIFGDVRGLAVVIAVVAALVFVVAGVGYLSTAAWWPTAAVVASGASLALILLTFTPWFLLGAVIDVVILVLAWRAR